MAHFVLHEAEEKDAESILAVYAPYVRETTITFEYEVPSCEEFRERMRNIMEVYPYLVCEAEGRPAGYAYAHRYHERAAYQWDAELSVYVDGAYTGRGIGRALYTALMNILKLQHVRNVYGLVTSPNPPSEVLHRAMGFRLSGVSEKTGYKLGKWVDVACFEKAIGSRAGEPEPLLTFAQVNREKEEAVERILREAEEMIGGR